MSEEMIVEEIEFGVANAAREKHFEQLPGPREAPFLMKLERNQ